MKKLMAILKNKKSLVSIAVISIILFFVILVISVIAINKMLEGIPVVEEPAAGLTEKSTVKSYLKYLSQPQPTADSAKKPATGN